MRNLQNPFVSSVLLLGALVGVALVSGCDLGSGPPPGPASIVVVAGADQAGTVATPVPVSPAVQVLTKKGKPVRNQEVVFSVAGGGGSLTGNVATTDREGIARLGTWILGPVAGVQSVQARTPGLAPVAISATALPDEPSAVTIEAGNSQVGVVGSTLGVRPSVTVKDRFGNPTPDVPVSFLVTEGGGFLSSGSAITDANGRAEAGAWTLGTGPGSNTLVARVGELDPVAFTANAFAGPPSRLTVLLGDGQVGVVGAPLPVKPMVLVADRFGNLLEGVEVRFQIASGGGTIGGDQAITGPGGVAVSGTWILGTGAGDQTLAVLVQGLEPVVLTATALPGLPATVAKLVPDDQVAAVATVVPEAPRVRIEDVHGNPIAGLSVRFEVSGSPDLILSPGTVTPGTGMTDANGIAQAEAWTMGTVAGAYEVTVEVPGLPDGAVFTAQAVPGPASVVSPTYGAAQSALIETPLAIPLGVFVSDEYGNGVAGVPMTFTVTGGGGSLGAVDTATDPTGAARAGLWLLGPTVGVQEVTVAVDGAGLLTFQATGLAAPAFDLDVEFLAPVDPSFLPAFAAAEARWEAIIVGDLPDLVENIPAGECQPVFEPAGLDDLKVYVTIGIIDGVGGVLGRAGPCYYRTPGPPMPLTGTMELDSDDLTALLADGMLEDVIVHEIGHILGFGTLWNLGSLDLLVGRGGIDPHFAGPGARSAFDAAGGEGRSKPKVPVENTGGAGTRDGHWRETVHDSELMTGWIEGAGIPNPLSAITVASLADMGFAVNMLAAEAYTVFNPSAAPGQDPFRSNRHGPRIFLKELPPRTPIPWPGGSPRR